MRNYWMVQVGRAFAEGILVDDPIRIAIGLNRTYSGVAGG